MNPDTNQPQTPQTPELAQLSTPAPAQPVAPEAPVQSVVPTPQPIAPAAAQPGKKLDQIGRSVFVFGVVLAVLGVIIAIGAAQSDMGNKGVSIAIMAAIVVANVWLALQGRAMRAIAKSGQGSARKPFNMSLSLGAAVLVLDVVLGLVEKSGHLGLAGLLAVVLVIYLLVQKRHVS